MTIRKKDHCFDYVVVGADLSGLLMAAGLIKKGFEVLLLDEADFPGGSARTVFTPVGLADNGLKIISYEESTDYAWITSQLSEIFGECVSYEIIDNGPITFANKEMKPVIGFGAHAPDFHKPLGYYLVNKRVNFLMHQKVITVGDFTTRLITLVGSSFVPKSLVTQFVQNEQSKITQVIVNGIKNIVGLHFVYCGSPKTISNLLPSDALPLKLRQKISKGTYWTTICLDFFHHGSICDRNEMHLLNGTTQDEIGPCVGIFHSPTNNIQHSQWLTFLDDESTSDTEAMGAILKKIKKQIKRAYPSAFDQLVSERIAVLPYNEAELDIKLTEKGTFPGLTNLLMASGAWLGHSNLVGNFTSTLKLLSSIEPLIPQNVQDIQML
jgi:hypothetical protein